VVDPAEADAAGNRTRDDPPETRSERPVMTTSHRSRPARSCGAALAAVALIALAACSSEADGAVAGLEPVLTFAVLGTDTLAFEPAAYAVIAGNAIELRLRSGDAVEHDFIVEGAGPFGSAFDQSGGHSHDDEDFGEDLHIAHAAAGEEVVSLFTISEPGVYDVYCSIPGHREAGMVGHLEVVAPG
jgi:uncharacterized cupredoxin-like copper-binding protein